jgi:hypothetical protein
VDDRFALQPTEVYALSHHLSQLLTGDESSTIGHVRLTARGGRRRWYATDSYVAGILEADHDGPDCDILLSPRILPPRVTEDSRCELAVPRLRRDGTFEGPATLRVDDLAVTQPVRFPVYPDLDSILGDAIAEPGAQVEVRTDALADLLAVLRIRPAGSAEHLNPPAFLTVGEGKISIHADWPGWGESRAAVEGADCVGMATAAVGLHLFQRLVDASPATVTLRVPVDRGQPVSVVSAGFYGLLMPRTWPDAAARLLEVQQILEQDLGIGHVEPDADGDLPVPFEDVHAYIRTVDGTNADVQVFTVLARDREADTELLQRINELNSVVRGCRLFIVDEQVLLEADLPGTELSPDTLRSTLNDVADTTRMIRTLFDA